MGLRYDKKITPKDRSIMTKGPADRQRDQRLAAVPSSAINMELIKELREEIKRERSEGGYGVESVKDGFIDMGREMVDTARSVYESEDVQDRLDQAKETALEMAEEGKKQVRKATRKYTRKATKAAKGAAGKAKRATRKATKSAGKFTRKKIAK